MHIADEVTRIGLRMGKDNLRPWMSEEQANEFATRITCSPQDAHAHRF